MGAWGVGGGGQAQCLKTVRYVRQMKTAINTQHAQAGGGKKLTTPEKCASAPNKLYRQASFAPLVQLQ